MLVSGAGCASRLEEPPSWPGRFSGCRAYMNSLAQGQGLNSLAQGQGLNSLAQGHTGARTVEEEKRISSMKGGLQAWCDLFVCLLVLLLIL